MPETCADAVVVAGDRDRGGYLDAGAHEGAEETGGGSVVDGDDTGRQGVSAWAGARDMPRPAVIELEVGSGRCPKIRNFVKPDLAYLPTRREISPASR